MENKEFESKCANCVHFHFVKYTHAILRHNESTCLKNTAIQKLEFITDCNQFESVGKRIINEHKKRL